MRDIIYAICNEIMCNNVHAWTRHVFQISGHVNNIM